MQHQETWVGTPPLDSVQRYSVAAVTGFVGSAAGAKARIARLVPSAMTEVLSVTNLPCIGLSLRGDWAVEPTLTAIAASLDAVVLFLGRSVSAAGIDKVMPEFMGGAVLAVRLWPPRTVVSLDELLPYKPLANMSRSELESLVRETLGGVLAQPRLERDRLVQTLWARHRYDTDSSAVRALGIDPRTLRRRRDRVLTLTGLDPARQRDRFRLDIGLHALRVLETAQSFPRRDDPVNWPYPRESHEPDIRPNFVIAEPTHRSSSSAPHPPRTTADRAGGEERKC